MYSHKKKKKNTVGERFVRLERHNTRHEMERKADIGGDYKM